MLLRHQPPLTLRQRGVAPLLPRRALQRAAAAAGSGSSNASPSSPSRAGPQLPAAAAAAALALALLQARGARAAAQPALPPAPQQQQQHAVVACHTPASLHDALRYRLCTMFGLPTVGKLLSVVAVAAPILFLGSALYRRAVGGCSWREALLKTYLVLNNCPGSSVESERGPAADLVLHGCYVAGLLTFAVVLGVLVEDIGSHVEQVRRGSHPVVERGHTVIVGWNAQALPILQQMALARAESGGTLFNGPVVVLADRDKEALDEEVAGVEGVHIITRSGQPTSPVELNRAATAAASTVVLLWPSALAPAQASAHQAAALSALRAAGGVAGQRVVVQSMGDSIIDFNAAQIAVELARASPGGQDVALLTSSGAERINQIMAQVANQPGLEDVLEDLLEYEERDAGQQADVVGAEFYCQPCPLHLEGQPYQAVRRSFPSAIVIGFVSGANGQLHLNPRDSATVPPGSQLVFVSHSVAEVQPAPQPYEASLPRLSRRHRRSSAPRNITCLCYDSSAATQASIVTSLAEFSTRGSQITLVAQSPDHAALKALKLRGVKLHVCEGDPNSQRVLASREARLEHAHAVVLAGLGAQPMASADVQVVASVLQLQALASSQQAAGKRRQPLAIVAQLRDPSSGVEDSLWHSCLSCHAELKAAAAAKAAAKAAADAARGRSRAVAEPQAAAMAAAAAVAPPVSLHLLRPNELKAGMITQTAAAPQLAQVFSELFTQAQGHEVYLRSPREAFGLPLNQPLRWSEIAEAVRRRGETAIGHTSCCSDADGSADAGAAALPASAAAAGQLGQASADVRLGLAAEQPVVLRQGDQLVVIALD